MTIEELRQLPAGTRLIWHKLDNTRFRPQWRKNTDVRLLRVTAQKAVVEYAFREAQVSPEWLSLAPNK